MRASQHRVCQRQSYHLRHESLIPISKSWIWCVPVITSYRWQECQSICCPDCFSLWFRTIVDTGYALGVCLKLLLWPPYFESPLSWLLSWYQIKTLNCLQQASKSCLTHFRRNGLTEVCTSFFQKGIYSLLEFQCPLGMRALGVSQILKVLIPGFIYILMLNYYLTVCYALLPI